MSLVPRALPETQPFWDGAAREKLVIQRCADCSGFYFPPSPVCPKCTSRNIDCVEVSGRGSLYSFVLTSSPWPQWGAASAMSVACVQLEEGPRLISTVVDCDQTPEKLQLDMPLMATWRPFGERDKMLCFTPPSAAS